MLIDVEANVGEIKALCIFYQIGMPKVVASNDYYTKVEETKALTKAMKIDNWASWPDGELLNS